MPQNPAKAIPATRHAEYSYFRAEGLSLSAIETVLEAKEELEGYRKTVLTKFGADEFMGGLERETGRFRFEALIFHAEDKIPPGWTVTRQTSSFGERFMAAFGLPPEGAAEHFYLANMAGLMERAAKLSALESVFGCGDMPRKDLPEGRYLGSFVRQESMDKGGAAAGSGRLRDNVTHFLGSNLALSAWDPLDFMKLDGNWYIRVPNGKGAGTPVFTPPDAVPVSYITMLEADRAEWDTRNGVRRYNFPGIH